MKIDNTNLTNKSESVTTLQKHINRCVSNK